MHLLWPIRTEPPALEPDEAHVWAVPLDAESSQRQDCWATLSADERQRANDFRFDDPRRRFVGSRAALRTLLGKYLGERAEAIGFSIGPSGKPQLASGHAAWALRFNLSHSGDLALIAIALGNEVGIDVEQLRAVSHLEQITKRYFHPDEANEVLRAESDDLDQAFFRCWTAKEAVLKSIGSGVAGRLDAFRVPTAEHEPCWVDLRSAQIPNAARCWLQQLAPCAGYVATVASLDLERSARCFAYSM